MVKKRNSLPINPSIFFITVLIIALIVSYTPVSSYLSSQFNNLEKNIKSLFYGDLDSSKIKIKHVDSLDEAYRDLESQGLSITGSYIEPIPTDFTVILREFDDILRKFKSGTFRTWLEDQLRKTVEDGKPPTTFCNKLHKFRGSKNEPGKKGEKIKPGSRELPRFTDTFDTEAFLEFIQRFIKYCPKPPHGNTGKPEVTESDENYNYEDESQRYHRWLERHKPREPALNPGGDLTLPGRDPIYQPDIITSPIGTTEGPGKPEITSDGTPTWVYIVGGAVALIVVGLLICGVLHLVTIVTTARLVLQVVNAVGRAGAAAEAIGAASGVGLRKAAVFLAIAALSERAAADGGSVTPEDIESLIREMQNDPAKFVRDHDPKLKELCDKYKRSGSNSDFSIAYAYPFIASGFTTGATRRNPDQECRDNKGNFINQINLLSTPMSQIDPDLPDNIGDNVAAVILSTSYKDALHPFGSLQPAGAEYNGPDNQKPVITVFPEELKSHQLEHGVVGALLNLRDFCYGKTGKQPIRIKVDFPGLPNCKSKWFIGYVDCTTKEVTLRPQTSEPGTLSDGGVTPSRASVTPRNPRGYVVCGSGNAFDPLKDVCIRSSCPEGKSCNMNTCTCDTIKCSQNTGGNICEDDCNRLGSTWECRSCRCVPRGTG